MAIVVTALGTAQSKTTTNPQVSGLTWALGDILIAVVVSDTGVTTSIPQWSESGSTWHSLGIKDAEAVNSGNVVLQVFRAATFVAASGSGAIRLNCNDTQAKAFAAYKVTGLATTPLDKTKTAVNTGTTPSSTDTAATTQADELLIGGIGTEGPDGDLPGTWNGDTTDNNQRLGTTGAGATSNITVAAATKIVAATGTYSADKTGIDSRDWAAAIATYKAAAVAPPTGTVYVVTTTGKRTQVSTGATAIKIDPTTGRRGTSAAFSKYLVRTSDGKLKAQS